MLKENLKLENICSPWKKIQNLIALLINPWNNLKINKHRVSFFPSWFGRSNMHHTLDLYPYHKSINLQYNTLVCWNAGTKDSWTKCLMFQVLFFTISCKINFFLWNKEFWVPQVYKKLWKKIMLGTSYAWSMSWTSHRPSDTAYYIEDCRISMPSLWC